MEEFHKVIEELGVLDIKPDRGWNTWTNNRLGDSLVKERIDRFFASEGSLANSDHDVIILDILGRKLRDVVRDPRLSFNYEACWVDENEAREIIDRA